MAWHNQVLETDYELLDLLASESAIAVHIKLVECLPQCLVERLGRGRAIVRMRRRLGGQDNVIHVTSQCHQRGPGSWIGVPERPKFNNKTKS